MTCTRCGRRLKNASYSGMGPKCSVYVLGSKPKRVRRPEQQKPDARQLALEGIE